MTLSRCWAFDAEVEDWSEHVLSAATSDDGERYVFDDYPAIRRWYTRIVGKRDLIWTFNGGRFDTLLWAEACAGLRIRGACSGGGLVGVRAVGHARILDAARLAPFMSLADFADGFGDVRKGDPRLPCRCGQCERGERGYGFCSVRRDMPRRLRKRLADYCIQDCDALMSAVMGLVTFAEGLGFDLVGRTGFRGTIGGWAWGTIRKMIGKDAPEPLGSEDDGLEMYDLERRAYYGGRCEVIRWLSDRGTRWDIRSAYPARMLGPLPHSVLLRVSPGGRHLAAGKPGAFRIEADVPRDGPPLLPMRNEKRTRLLWATGRVEGWYLAEEIRAAERHGLKIRRVREGVLVRETPWLRPYIRDLVWPAREKQLNRIHTDECKCLRCRRARVRAKWLKTAGNCLSGKMAQSKNSRELVLGTDKVPKGSELLSSEGGAWAVPSVRVPDCAHPLAAGGITAGPRIQIMDSLCDPDQGVIYCDTDGTPREGRAPATAGKGLGRFAREGSYRRWLALAPKLYRYLDERGRWRTRAKGIPDLQDDDFVRLMLGDTVVKRKGVMGALSALRASDGERLFLPRTIRRSLRDGGLGPTCGTRLRLADGGTRPLHREADGTYGWPGSKLDPYESIGDL